MTGFAHIEVPPRGPRGLRDSAFVPVASSKDSSVHNAVTVPVQCNTNPNAVTAPVRCITPPSVRLSSLRKFYLNVEFQAVRPSKLYLVVLSQQSLVCRCASPNLSQNPGGSRTSPP